MLEDSRLNSKSALDRRRRDLRLLRMQDKPKAREIKRCVEFQKLATELDLGSSRWIDARRAICRDT